MCICLEGGRISRMEQQNIVKMDQREGARTKKGEEIIRGMKAGISIGVGYIPIAITFGLLARAAGVPNSISIMMSLFVYAGASQFVGVNLLALHTGYWEIILTTFILNFRHFLMSASISQRIEKGLSKPWMAVLAFGITDESFAVASLQKEEQLNPWFLLGLNVVGYSAWNVGTWLGVFLGTALPDSVQTSMGIALYAMFIGLLVPAARETRAIFHISMLAVLLHGIFHWTPGLEVISTGWKIVMTTILASAAGAVLYKEEAL